jgi:hypothetical protein
MPWYGHGRERCAYCRHPSVWACDFRDDAGATCSKPLCSRHRIKDDGEDRCPEHAAPAECIGLSGDRAGRRS